MLAKKNEPSHSPDIAYLQSTPLLIGYKHGSRKWNNSLVTINRGGKEDFSPREGALESALDG